ncbi:MAG TPA: hypothetical protein VI565_09365, partial [Burkholderiales bacterium]|nr:hypothetical protein [Burkholderiales bacterium]
DARKIAHRVLLPTDPDWPIVTSGNFGDANPKPETEARFRAVRPEGEAPLVVPGFVGKDSKGRPTTLGRGGSDLTAVLAAVGVEASELVVVKGGPGRPLAHNAPVHGDYLQAKAVKLIPPNLSIRFVYPAMQ